MEHAALRLASTPFRVEQYAKKQAPIIAHSTLRHTIVKTALQHGMTLRQLAHLSIRSQEDTVDIHLKYWGPVLGTAKRHRWFVKPKEKKALHWTAGGNNFFSKGHFVSGIDAKWVLDRGIKAGIARFSSQLQHSIENFLEVTRMW